LRGAAAGIPAGGLALAGGCKYDTQLFLVGGTPKATSQRRRPALHDVRRELRPGAGGGPALRQHRPFPYGEPLCHVQRALRAIVPLRAPDPRQARAGPTDSSAGR